MKALISYLVIFLVFLILPCFNHLSAQAPQGFNYQAGARTTEGYFNIMLGNVAGQKNTTGYNNIFMGAYSGRENQAGRPAFK